MNLSELLRAKRVLLDGGMGTLLQAAGLPMGVLPESWNLTECAKIEAIHRAYLEAGADVVYANTFGASPMKFGDETEAVIAKGVAIAKQAAAGFSDRLVALDIGPLGRLLRPLGDLDFEDAVAAFGRMARTGAGAGADLVVIETMNDLYELRAAMLGVRENCELPIMVSCVFGADGKLMTGADPSAVVALAESLGASAVGLNCSLGPEQMLPVAEKMLKVASIPVFVKPNAGLPVEKNGKTVYDVDVKPFTDAVCKMLDMGVSAVGGCCGTTPDYTLALCSVLGRYGAIDPTDKGLTVVSSYTHAVCFGGAPVLIGERINPTGKKRLKQALLEHDMTYILGEGLAQSEHGAHLLDVNVGLPDIDESTVLAEVVCELQSVTDLPLQIDTASPEAMERALRLYNGKPLVNSVSGKQEVMDAIFPLVRKYGGAVIALTLDEEGIPTTAEGRVAIAERIVAEAAKYGIAKKDIIFDTLAMAVSADDGAPRATLDALDDIRHRMGIHTSLGVSNVSFGLPMRDAVNAAFFAMAMQRGLSAAIMNPLSDEMMKTYRSFCALSGLDKNCLSYIDFVSGLTPAEKISVVTANEKSLRTAIEKGLKQEAERASEKGLESREAMVLINEEIIPALDAVGKGFESGKIFLPQLLMSAEAASSAFEIIKRRIGSAGQVKKLRIVIATVKGDIHDIGKNIVKTLLENYGFRVTDLGKDVPSEKIVESAIAERADVVGLSALMTTTVASMEATIALLKEKYPACRTLVGGAVLTSEYAARIGADAYAADAMESVRYCEELEKTL